MTRPASPLHGAGRRRRDRRAPVGNLAALRAKVADRVPARRHRHATRRRDGRHRPHALGHARRGDRGQRAPAHRHGGARAHRAQRHRRELAELRSSSRPTARLHLRDRRRSRRAPDRLAATTAICVATRSTAPARRCDGHFAIVGDRGRPARPDRRRAQGVPAGRRPRRRRELPRLGGRRRSLRRDAPRARDRRRRGRRRHRRRRRGHRPPGAIADAVDRLGRPDARPTRAGSTPSCARRSPSSRPASPRRCSSTSPTATARSSASPTRSSPRCARVRIVACGTSYHAGLAAPRDHRDLVRPARRGRGRLRAPLPRRPGRPGRAGDRHHAVRRDRRHAGRHALRAGARQPRARADQRRRARRPPATRTPSC